MVKSRKYEKIAKIGDGGFGDVYAIRHKLTGKIFALKKANSSETRLAAWISEVKAMMK